MTNSKMENDNNIIKISGSIGMVKLISNNKNIYVFYDDHSNISYCKNFESIFLYEMFEKIIKNYSDYIILLEEPFIKNYSNIKFLWNETPHVIKFRNFYKKIICDCSQNKTCKIFPIDIRLIICDVSIDELISNLKLDEYFDNYKISIYEYFKQIMYIFNYIQWDDKLFENVDQDIKFLKKVFDKFMDDEYYIKLKSQFNMFYKVFIEPNKFIEIKIFLMKNLENKFDFFTGYPFENSNENIFLNQYDKLINGIMELYTYILINGLNYKNVIIYSGYYHSNNLTYILKKYCNYKEIYNIGNTNDIEKKDEKSINNCLYLDKKIFS